MGFDPRTIIIPLITLSVSTGLLLLARGIAIRLLHKWAKSTDTRLDDIVIASIKIPSILWILAIAVYVTIGTSEIPEKYAFYLIKTLHVVIIASVTIAAANLTGKIFRHYVEKTEIPIPTTGLAHGLIKGLILVVGFLIILGSLGISITPLITALGVGGLAVALALQDTLSNLFAGIHILVEKPLRGRNTHPRGKTFEGRRFYKAGNRAGRIRGKHRLAHHKGQDASEQHGHNTEQQAFPEHPDELLHA